MPARHQTIVLALAAVTALSAAPGRAEPPSPGRQKQVDQFAQRTGLPRASVVAVTPDLVVAIRDRDALAARAPADPVRLQGEAVDDEAAARLGWRSMRSVVGVNCESRRDKVLELEVFDQPALKGPGRKRPVPGGWVQPSEDAYMSDVIRAVCRAAPRAEAAPQAPSEAPAPPTPAPKPAPPALKPPQLRPASAPPPPKPASGGPAVQLGALDSEADARRLLSKAGPLGPGLSTEIQAAQVGTRTFYRARIIGFATRREAQAWCDKAGGDCLVR